MRRHLKPGTGKRLEHCGPAGKVIFRSENAALDAIPKVHAQRTKRRARDIATMECRAYRCQFGDHYHLSSRRGAA